MNKMMVKKMVQSVDLQDTPAPIICREVAEREARQTQALARLVDAHGLDYEVQVVNADDRAELLYAAVEAAMTGEFVTWWWETVAPEVMDNPDKAQSYVGDGPDEWNEALREWYRAHYVRGTADTPLEHASPGEIAEIADKHTRHVYGLSLREFVSEVVNWSTQKAFEGVLAGPSNQTTAILEQFAQEAESDV